MALTPQVFHVPFAGGIDEATAPQLVNPHQSVALLQNALHTKRGSVSKSRGCTTSPYTRTNLAGASFTTGLAICSTGDGLLHIDGSRYARCWSPSAGAWAEVNRIPLCDVTRRPVAGIPSDDVYTCAAYNSNGVYAVGYIQDRGSTAWLRMTVVDRVSGTTLHDTWIDATEDFRVASCGNYLVIVYENSSGNMTIDYLDATDVGSGWTSGALTWSGHKAGLRSSSGVLLYDVAQLSTGNVVVAYAYGSGANRVYIRQISTSTWTSTYTTSISTATTDPEQVSITVDDVLWVSYNYGTAARVVCLAVADLTSVGTTATWDTFTTALPWASIVVTGTQTAAIIGTNSTDAETRYCTLSISAGAVVAGTVTSMSVGPVLGASHAFRYGSRNYALFLDALQYSYALVDWSGASWDANSPVLEGTFAQRLVPQQASAYTALAHQRAMNPATGVYEYAVPVKRSPGSCSTEIVRFDFAGRTLSTARSNAAVLLSGGVVTQYDGRSVEEVNHVEAPTFTLASGGAGTLGGGTYQYIVIYERADATGAWHPSAPSATQTIVHAGVTSVTVTIYPPISRRAELERTRAAIYRTEDAKNTFYLVTYQPMPASGVLYVTYDDALPDTPDLISNATLYTQPGTYPTAQPRRAPPALRYITQHQDKIVGLADDSVSTFCSAAVVRGEGVWFTDAFQVQVEYDGDTTAHWSQSGRLIVAKASSLYVLDGDGFTDSGAGGFTPAVRIPSDVGCTNHNSVCVTDMGTFFQSRRGIELLDRSFQVRWIGEAVEDTLATYPVIAAALLDEAAGFVRFACVDSLSAPTTGRILVYDIQNQAWSVHVYADEAISMTMHGGVWHWLSSTGQVYQERAVGGGSDYLDGSTWRTMRVVTGWFTLGMLQDTHTFQIQLLLEQHTDHDLTVEIAYDYDPDTWVAAGTWDSDEVYGELGGTGCGAIELDPKNARAHAFRLRITDATPSGATHNTVGTGQGSTFVGLSIATAARSGTKSLARLAPSARR